MGPFNRSQRDSYQAHRGADNVYFSIHIFMSCFGAGKGVNSKGYQVKTKPTLLLPVGKDEGEQCDENEASTFSFRFILDSKMI